MSSVVKVSDGQGGVRLDGLFRKSAAPQTVLFLCLVFLLSGCDDYYTIAMYDTSPIVYRIRDKEFNIGDTIMSPDSYDRICLIYPLELISKFSKHDFNPDFSEEYFRVLIANGDSEKVELIHESWIVIETRNNLCAGKDEEIFVSKFGNNGRIYLNKREAK
ncbi:hypothetical protein FMN50_01380 [Rhodobacterales bacterium]|nr:hypothetical protein FMN50_01380 [Rhodobacterales bacterium]